jgi:NAD(P)-dependent dehydrogenase (short-subunit alcohol dehydrogenase family)
MRAPFAHPGHVSQQRILHEEVAAVIMFLCSERATYLTGEIGNVDGGGTHCI